MKFNELISVPSTDMIALSVCNAADMDVLTPIYRLYKESNMTFHLVDDKPSLESLLKNIDPQLLNNERMIIHHAESDTEAAAVAVSLVASGEAHMLMKGMVATSVILKEVLNKAHNLIEKSVLSHVALFDLPNYDKAVLITDCAMNINPNVEQKEAIIHNAVEVAHNLGITTPKVALLSAVEKVNPKIQSTVDADELKTKLKDSENFIIDGPLQYDLAISKAASRIKGLDSPVAGDADILIAPALDAGNMLYKSLVYSASANVAAIIVGAKVPIVLTSRADDSEVKYLSIKLAMNNIK